MQVQVEFWQLLLFLVGLLLSFLGFVFGAGKLLLAQMQRSLDQRFEAQEAARAEAQKHWDALFGGLKLALNAETQTVAKLEKDFLALRAELPLQYVRREDWIRFSAVIEAKQDRDGERLVALNTAMGRLSERLEQTFANGGK